MAMTMTQKILAVAAGLEEVKPGQLIEAELDLVLGNDITAPVAIKEFEKIGADKVFDRERVAIVLDHFTPNKDIKSAEHSKLCRDFAKRLGIKHFYDVGRMGVEHCLIPELGLAAPGDVIIGADSHTCTYGALGAFSTGTGSTDMACAMASGRAWFKVPAAVRFTLTGAPQRYVGGKDVILNIIGKIGVDGALYKSMEFAGPGVAALTMADRFTIANMAVEAGAKNGIFPVDERTLEYTRAHVSRERGFKVYEADSGAPYEGEHTIDLSLLRPTVAFPHLPENARVVDELDETVNIDQAVIGSCTNGRIEDLRIAAEILKGRQVAARTIILPGTQATWLEAVREGLAEVFVNAGAVFSTPTCGPCLGGYMGILAAGERAVSTTNRNFVGRMGHTESEVYLAGPAVAAASAVLGRIASPEELL
ncbi:MAG: 3-isopropylmalate dehydratase large subunit [Clostridiales bacterium]|jgi:3-isopropylmalate/(R)-2-methylmalate dehydratase large subunit|nr:3-isopropylmalate dehydratase large subunit [Clostridiales bacterium]